jgi:hypothetical protein
MITEGTEKVVDLVRVGGHRVEAFWIQHTIAGWLNVCVTTREIHISELKLAVQH